MFYNIRTDLDKLQCASNITKIVNEVTTENQNTYRVLQLYLNTLYTISETDKNLSLVTSTFVLRLLSIIGYKPIIEECQNCKTKDDLNYFSSSTTFWIAASASSGSLPAYLPCIRQFGRLHPFVRIRPFPAYSYGNVPRTTAIYNRNSKKGGVSKLSCSRA